MFESYFSTRAATRIVVVIRETRGVALLVVNVTKKVWYEADLF